MTAFDPTFTLALHQLAANPTGADYLDRAIASVRAAAAQGANICVLPELFRSPYFCQEMEPRHFDLAEPVPGPTTERLGKLAAELGVVIVASLFERAMAGLHYNTTAVLDADGRFRHIYGRHPQVLGCAPEALLGRRVPEALPREAADSLSAGIRKALDTRRLQTAGFELATAEGTRVFEGRLLPMEQEIEGSPCVVLSIRDITERTRAEEIARTKQKMRL